MLLFFSGTPEASSGVTGGITTPPLVRTMLNNLAIGLLSLSTSEHTSEVS